MPIFNFGDISTFDDDRLQHWVGWSPDPLERVRFQRDHWVRWLEKNHAYAFGRLKRLVALGCDRDQLVFYLYHLKFDASASSLSPEQFKSIVKRLEEAVDDLDLLINSGLGLVLDETWNGAEELADIPHDMRELLDALDSFEDWATQKHNALLDDGKLAIVRHVRERTHAPHHGEVAALIDAALEKPYKQATHMQSSKAHKQWVHLHKDLLEQETHHEKKWRELTAARGRSKPKP
jgi:hypothetical protein